MSVRIKPNTGRVSRNHFQSLGGLQLQESQADVRGNNNYGYVREKEIIHFISLNLRRTGQRTSKKNEGPGNSNSNDLPLLVNVMKMIAALMFSKACQI